MNSRSSSATLLRDVGAKMKRVGGVVHVHGELAGALATPVALDHLVRMSDHTAIFEHAEFATPRREHGYCTDDVSRALLVSTMFGADPAAAALAEVSLGFLRDAVLPDNRFRSRMSFGRRWMDDGDSDDACGRALWGIGTAAMTTGLAHVRRASLAVFDRTSGFRSKHWHATAFAVLGAAAVLETVPDHRGAAALIRDASRQLPRGRSVGPWPWPEKRITYAPALLTDALMAAGAGEEGLALLRWLHALVVRDGWFSPVPVEGFGLGEHLPGFDQQPIEAQAFASAAWRAWILTDDVAWLELLVHAAAWFFGANDGSLELVDRFTHGCCDGLQADGRNENQGAESTLAFLHTMAILQRAIDCGAVVVHAGAPSETRRRS